MACFNIKFCDMCGKRTDELDGRLTLQTLEQRQGMGHKSLMTVWSKRLCKRCLHRFSAMETLGDRLKDEIELKLDKIQAIKGGGLELLGEPEFGDAEIRITPRKKEAGR